MTDHYEQLGVLSGAKTEEIEAAFQQLLVTRRAKRQRTSDLHVAHAVLSDRSLRRAYDLARFGIATSDRFIHTKAVTVKFAKDHIPDIDVLELMAQAREVALKAAILGSGAVARTAEMTSTVSRAVQLAASRRLSKTR